MDKAESSADVVKSLMQHDGAEALFAGRNKFMKAMLHTMGQVRQAIAGPDGELPASVRLAQERYALFLAGDMHSNALFKVIFFVLMLEF